MIDETEILASLDAKTRKRVQLAKEFRLEKQPTPSVGLNLALQGGLAYGRQVLIWGSKSAGKSLFALGIVADVQRQGKSCAWIDAEQAFDASWAERIGVDTKKLLYSDSNAVAKVANDAVAMVRSGVDVLVIDSISTILASSYFDGDEMKNFEDTGQIGTHAKDMGRMSNMILGVNDGTLVIMISQQRTGINATYTKMKPMGGEAMLFNSSTVLKLWSSESDTAALTGEIQSGDKVYAEKIGKKVRWDVEYNKTGPQGLTGTYDMYYKGNTLGIDNVAEIADLGIKYGFIEETGKGWFAINDKKLHGRTDVLRVIKESPEIYNQLKERIYEQA